MPWHVTLLIVGVFLLMDSIIVGALLHALAQAWRAMGRGCSPQPPLPGAISRQFQSFKLGIFNLGLCVHVTVDERFLHLHPAAFLRLFGAGPFSIPWELVSIEPAVKPGRYRGARINGQRVIGPAWALSLAPGASDDVAGA